MKKCIFFIILLLMLISSAIVSAASVDINGDEIVNLMDIARVGMYWGQPGCGSCGGADITGDGEVDIDDLVELAAQWLAHIEPPASPVGAWIFDDGTADDSSGNDHDGTLVGNAQIIEDVERDNILSLDGYGDYLKIDDNISSFSEKTLTVSAWIKPNSVDETRVILDKSGIFLYKLVNGQQQFTATGKATYYSTSMVTVDEWQHVAVIFAGNSNVKFYRNGSLISQTGYAASLNTSADSTRIGCDSSGSYYFDGMMDDVRVYDYALSDEQISDLAKKDYCMISGRIIDVDAMYDMDNIAINGLPGNPVTDESGAYGATVDYGWSGTLTPVRAGFTFEPSNWEYDNVTADHTDNDFYATVIRYPISGYVGTVEGVEFPDLPCGVMTDANGFYSCDVDYGWSGTVIPGVNGYTFSPSDRSYSNVTSPQSNQDFTPIINTYTISGYIGTLQGVVISGLPGSPITDQTGYYVGTVEYGWSGTVTPQKQYYSFSPSNKTYSNVTSDQNDQDYSPQTAIADVNMLGRWTFDEDNANDSSGYDHDGTLTGDASIIDDPVRGKVLQLDGDGDYVGLGNGTWADIKSAITIAAWVKVDTFTKYCQTIVAKGITTYRLGRSDNKDAAEMYINTVGNGGNYIGSDGVKSINDGLWHHVVATYDSSISGQSNLLLYIDGQIDSAVKETSGNIIKNTEPLRIGSNSENDRDWDGLIDDVRLYNKAMTAAQIANLYTSENPDLVGWWKFDGDAKDSSGREHHGTMVGDVAIVNDSERGQVLQVSTGTDITDNWVDCGGGSSDRNWATLGNEMTVMAWVKTDSFTSEWQYIVTKGNSFMVGRYNVDAKLRFKTGHWTSVNLIGATASDVTGGDWHHVAAVYDGASRYLYIDGQLNTSDNCTGMLEADDYNLLIGGYTGYENRCWKGYIDDVKLFNRSLSATEVRVEAGMLAAEIPSPSDLATDVPLDKVLSWRAGPLADTVGGHDVYFGTSFEDVNSRNASVFMGNQSETSYDPGQLYQLTTYYWAIDSNNDEYEDDSPWLGQVWSFTTVDLSLVGLWNFNDGTPSDSSGNGYDGTLTGDAVIVDDTERGKVLKLDGDGDYVNLGNGAWTNPGNNMTIAAWIKVSAYNASYQCVMAKGNQTYRLQRTGSGSSLAIFMNYTSSSYKSASASTNVNDGNWHHVLALYNGSDIKIYIDGKQESSNTLSTLYTNSDPLCIGRNSDETGRDWQGWIDDVRMYDKALSIEEIRELAGIQKAKEPYPVYRKVEVDTYPTLSWKAAPLAAHIGGHDLYFGTSGDLVAARDASVYIGALDSNSYQTDMLTLGTTYYWLVDEVNDAELTSPWQGDLWMFQTRNSSEGVYADIITDGGPGVSAYDDQEIPAINMLGYKSEFINASDTVAGRAIAAKLMGKTDDGEWQDDNGILLYPDREPRYRLYYCNGGHAGGHYSALATARQEAGLDLAHSLNGAVEEAYYNGMSYTGSCAGAFLCKTGYWNINGGAGTTIRGTNIGGTYTDGTIPDGDTLYQAYVDGEWIDHPGILPVSPLIRENYYPELFNDYNVHGIFHNGGCRLTVNNEFYKTQTRGTEALVLFDVTWTLKVDYQFDPDWEDYVKDYTINPAASGQREDHHQPMAWAYKPGDYSGRSAPCGSHPERRTYFGEEKYLQASFFRYASSGFGRANVKAALTSGVTRQMDDNSTAGHEKVGDKQYHHFTIEVPQGASQLQITLDGEMYDLNLYAKKGDFAFMGEPETITATNTNASDETLTINNPEPGTWFIGIKCNTTVTRTRLTNYWKYTGNFEVLDGIAYDITATVTE